MNLYSGTILVAATVYIKAETLADAQTTLDALKGDVMELAEDEHSELPISGRQYNHPDLPDVSLSPCMTIHAIADAAELHEESIDAEEGDDDAEDSD